MEYLVNEKGERTRVVLTVEEYEELVNAREELEDARDHERVMADVRSGKEERTLRRSAGSRGRGE